VKRIKKEKEGGRYFEENHLKLGETKRIVQPLPSMRLQWFKIRVLRFFKFSRKGLSEAKETSEWERSIDSRRGQPREREEAAFGERGVTKNDSFVREGHPAPISTRHEVVENSVSKRKSSQQS